MAGVQRAGGQNYDPIPTAKYTPQNLSQKIGAAIPGFAGGLVAMEAGGINPALARGAQTLGAATRINPILGPKVMATEELLAKINNMFGKKVPQISVPTPPLSPTGQVSPIQAQKGIKTAVGEGINATLGIPGIQSRTTAGTGETILPKVQTKLPKANISLQTRASTPILTPQEVAATLPSKIDNFINDTLGYSTAGPVGGTKQANIWTKTLRGGQEIITRKVESGLGSENALIRNAASTMQNFFRGLGMSPERANASMELRGSMSVANERAFNVMDSLYKTIGRDKGSLERINAVLDPTIAKTPVSFEQLTPKEQQVYGLIRKGLDIVHDTSYANGNISKELYQKNMGKYNPGLYDVFELPVEVNKFVTQGMKKLNNEMYKAKTGISDWKVEHALNDPVYGLGKRLAQVETNTAIKKYTNFLVSNPRLVSDIERPGFVKLSDSPAYGALSGKYVLNSAAEDLKGFFFSNTAMQNLYDVFRAYDRMPIRQLQKKLLTVFNPTTNVGNIVSDQVFGFVTGVDPLTLNKNLLELMANPSKYKQLADYLMRKGIVGTDITRTDFVNKLAEIDSLAIGKKPEMFSVAARKVQSFYGGTDDVYKTSAFKALLDRGFSLEEATRKVADGFQNYANVGKFYDVWAKTPVVGSAFIKFQGDLIRIIKNGAVNNPLGLITFLGTLWSIARLSSKLSGETPQDRQTRENRFAAPMIPGLNIPLTWQTPLGEINAARYISPFFANNETTGVAKMFPFMPRIDTKKDVATNIAQNVNDPLLSGPIQALVNRDFRGKPISDPNENKYQPSTLTPSERLKNQALFLGRNYLPPPVNSAIDVASVARGGKDMYGRTQTVPQSLARLGGIKITQFGSQQAEEQRQKDVEYQQKGNKFIDEQINSVYKQQLKGEITPEQVKTRTDYLQQQKKDVSVPQGTSGKMFRYLDDKGTMQTIDLSFPLKKYTPTGNETLDKELLADYKGSITSAKNNVMEAWQAGAITQEEAVVQLEKLVTATNKIRKPKQPRIPRFSPRSYKLKKVKLPKYKTSEGKMFKVPKLKKTKRIKLAKAKKTKYYKVPKQRFARAFA